MQIFRRHILKNSHTHTWLFLSVKQTIFISKVISARTILLHILLYNNTIYDASFVRPLTSPSDSNLRVKSLRGGAMHTASSVAPKIFRHFRARVCNHSPRPIQIVGGAIKREDRLYWVLPFHIAIALRAIHLKTIL